ncbi:BACK domain-containing protein [Trichostrongylus colubriformis]|uniref:BACK domain-containing protein n=1 Tax=Trichostrongylus colubriformis TaxID=6319 RepID=A0AAN8FQW4_TRICO
MSNDRKTSLEMNEVQKRADVAEKAEHIREFEGMRINAHRNVLAASSDYFKAMFTNDMVESRSLRHGPTFGGLVGDCEASIAPVAERMVVLRANKNKNTVMVKLSEFHEVFAAVLQWIRFNPPDRKQFLSKLLKHVRLSLCGTEFLVNTVSKDALVSADRACRKLVDEAKDYQLLQLSGPVRPNMRVTRSRNRKAVEWKECIYIVGGSVMIGADTSVECFDGENPVWRRVASMSKGRSNFAVGVIDNLLYAVGGRVGNTFLNSSERYDSVADRWTSDVSLMSTSRSGLGVAALDGFLYSVGGCYAWRHLDSVERYDARRNEWIHVAPMAYSRSGLSVSVLNGCLYAVGGENSRSLNIVERLDPRVGKWETIRSMSIARKYLGTAVLNGVLYAVGGDDSVWSTSEKYDPLTNTWTFVATMDDESYNFGLAVFNESLYAFGCYRPGHDYRIVETFDLETNQWKIHTRTSDDRRGAGVGVVRMPS